MTESVGLARASLLLFTDSTYRIYFLLYNSFLTFDKLASLPPTLIERDVVDGETSEPWKREGLCPLS